MLAPARLFRRLRLLARRAQAERSMDEEMRDHLERETEERIRRGMTPEEARRSALVDFGGVEAAKEDARDARGGRVVEDLGRDVAYGLRVLRRNPGFTAGAVLTFALGVGAATAIFSAVEAVLLRPLPYEDPSRLVALWERNTLCGKDRNVVSVASFEAWRERSRSFEGMAALVPAPLTISDPARPEHVLGVEASPGYFRLIGVAPALGREYTDADRSVVVLSDGFWRRRFGGDRSVLGRTLLLDGTPRTIVGVMPPDLDPPRFGWIDEQQLWLPFTPTAENRAWGRALHVVARLRPGVGVARADAEIDSMGRSLAREKKSSDGWTATARPLAAEITGEVRAPLLALLGAVGLLLLMSVTNVALLSLALTRRREHELSVRRALGATRGRIFQQLFVQSALVGSAGGAIGLLAASGGVRLLRLQMPPDVPRVASIALDAPVLLAGLGGVALATVAFGTLTALRGPALGADAPDLARTRSTPRAGGGALVTVEIALALVLAVLAGLMVRSFAGLRAVDLGFAAERVVVGRVSLEGARYATEESRRAFFDALLQTLRAAPPVSAASLVSVRPFRGGGTATTIADATRAPAGTLPPAADVRFVDPEYFSTLGMPVVSGATFDARDAAPGAPPRVLVDRSAARALWPSESAVGHRLAIQLVGGITAEVAGVVGDARLASSRTPPRPAVYLAASRFPSPVYDVVLRGDAPPETLADVVRSAVARLDPSLPVYDIAPLSDVVDAALARDRFVTFLLSAFAAVSLLLAAVGIYGVFTADVSRRRRELGIRLALGARPSRVLGLVLASALGRAVWGIAIGCAAALVLARSMSSLLFGVGPADPISFSAAALLMLVVALLATLLPAWSASRVSPLLAIRSE